MNESDLIIRFLSCSVGQAPAELQRIRQASGAGEAFAPTCFRVVHTKGPINMTPPTGTPTAFTSDLRRVYFENGGQLVAVWMSANDLHAPYSAGTTICAKDHARD